MKQTGQLLQSDYFDNIGGLNISDSVFKIPPTSSTGGTNFQLVKTGAITKRNGHAIVNTIADTQLNTLGLGLRNTQAGVKTVIRAAGTKLQAVDLDALTFTNLTEDTVTAGSDFLTSGSTQQVIFKEFNTATTDVLWSVGGGMTTPRGVYSTSKVTENGVATPTGSITATPSADSGTFVSTGTYFYGVAFHKASTGATGNVALDTSATISATTNQVTIGLTGITAFDTTKYDQIWIYRSAVGGTTAFTTGDIIAKVTSTATSYVDTGTSISSSQNVPRAGNTILDNSPLPAGTYKTLAVWKQRLVVSNGSTVYFSDRNKPESWPTVNTVNVQSGGDITGLAIISFSTDYTNDEILGIFKERELWMFTGNSTSDWALKYVDGTGVQAQPLIVYANGFLTWVSSRGIHLWDGSGKPVYLSKPIEPLFDTFGAIDKTKLGQGHGAFYQKDSVIVWYLSHKVYGEQKFQIRFDLRLSLPKLEDTLNGRVMDSVFTQESTSMAVYASLSFLPQATVEEYLLLGDASGFVYHGYTGFNDASSAISATYLTPYLAMGDPNQAKRFLKVIVWVEKVGAWPLTLDYWTGYKSADADKSTQALDISTVQQSATALWDVAFWDVAMWDDFTADLQPLVFNLSPGFNNNNEGDCIRLQFRQEGADQPVTIEGYTVIYSEKGLAK